MTGRDVSIRLDDATLARVDALAPRYTQPWRVPTRSDLLRVVILAGLAVEEQQAPPAREEPPTRRRARGRGGDAR